MEAAYFIIAILGCGEGDAPCQPVRTLDAHYESQAACSQATEAALVKNSDADFPVVVAQCVAAGSTPGQLKPNEVERPGAGRVPIRPDRSPVRS